MTTTSFRDELQTYAPILNRFLAYGDQYDVRSLEVVYLWLCELEGCVEERIERLLAPQQRPAYNGNDPRSDEAQPA